MEEFKKRIAAHIEHVKKVGAHCATEETTKQALILPLLDILGFSPYIRRRLSRCEGKRTRGLRPLQCRHTGALH